MVDVDTYLHLIGGEVLIILGIVIPLLDDKTHKRALSFLFAAVLGLMLVHLVSYVLPKRLANFIYSSHHAYRSLQTQETQRI
ncbi:MULTISPECIES: hypothetical protein [Methylomicrobium]|uniref:Uncharacterized protein n=1 Tax=Methylomicrobium album BG8 TaxID=686340 RepID=H8GK15_METAL|nr:MULTISPECIES: hypothetical protein [Methylomicrobium]EIC27974.1 hypothetical protein Metal_0105 [Methylomicrobium album BG8]